MLPVDSEHNAMFQALTAGRREDVSRVIITASGGPFRTWTREQIRKRDAEQALKHPNWSMGPKVTIDSATLMNKGLELIEAHHLFASPAGRDRCPGASAVDRPWPGRIPRRLGDRAARLARHAHPDRPLPGLAGPHRRPGARLDLAEIGSLTFEEPDLDAFPGARARAAGARDRAAAPPTVLNAANEVAVAEFLAGTPRFAGIPALVEATLEAAAQRGLMREPAASTKALAIDHDARTLARELLPEIAAKAF